jgi:glycosyltransferase involved in cell wall biosynthesis
MKIIHITEALGGGIAHSLSQLAKAQATDGHHVIVVHSLRSDTPVDLLPGLYPAPIDRRILPMVTAINPIADVKALLQIRALLRIENPDVIHLHSSKAGVLGRLAALLTGRQDQVFYSPRGFAFLREDVSPSKQKLFLNLERVASKLGGTVIACSRTESDLARFEVGHKRTCLVENSVDLSVVPIATGMMNEHVRIVTSGRICYQKAPWRFRNIATGCADLPAYFVWLGDGDLRADLVVDGVHSAVVRIAGWLPRVLVYAELAAADIFVLPSLWEGMPLALIEAQAAGLPAVVSDVVGNRDVVINGETGFVCHTDLELLQKTRLLIEDAGLRWRMGQAARDMAAERFSVGRMHREMMAAYNNQRVVDAG